MGGRHTGDDPAAESPGAELDPALAHRHQKIGHGHLPCRRRAGPGQIGDLDLPQEGPGDHVAELAFGDVDDLSHQRVRVKRLLGPVVGGDVPAQGGVGVAEAGQGPSP